MKNSNKSLFWYGFRARLIKVFGVLITIIGMCVLPFKLWIGIIIMIIGIIMMAKGSSSEYDYKRQGGYIVYND